MRTAVQITPQAGDVYAWLEQFNVFLQKKKSLQILGGQLRKWLFNHPRSCCALSLLMAPYWRLRAIRRRSMKWPFLATVRLTLLERRLFWCKKLINFKHWKHFMHSFLPVKGEFLYFVCFITVDKGSCCLIRLHIQTWIGLLLKKLF